MKTHSKKVTIDQRYEEYWKLTVEYTNINGYRFINTLQIIVDYIDSLGKTRPRLTKNNFTQQYQELQDIVLSVFSKRDMASTRKSINQFVKLGFVRPFLSGYHPSTKKFLKATNDEQRRLLFSEIFYSSASFNSSCKNDDTSTKQINFLIKTLTYHPLKKLTEDDLAAIMQVRIRTISKGYLTFEELESQKKLIEISGFADRKYNQISYFKNFLKRLPGLVVYQNEIAFEEDAPDVLPASSVDAKRDPYLFNLMKNNLFEESKRFYNNKIVCYFTKQEQPKGLVVSHIYASAKALKELNVEAAYDYRNAILLEPNTDAYFDKYNVTFEDSGLPIYDSSVPKYFISNHENDKLDSIVLYESRKQYLDKHRNEFYRRNPSMIYGNIAESRSEYHNQRGNSRG